nr:acyl-CoA thioesterase [Allomuricauda sp.]
MRTYTESLVVKASDLDQNQHVNNVRYVEWIQEISKSHWEVVVHRDERANMVWVVKNHNISYQRPAFLGDELVLKTHIQETKGPLSYRVVEISNNKTGEVVVKAITQWCLLDAATLKPKRVPEDIQTKFQ